MVSTPEGPRRIEDIKVGDLVLSVDEVTGEIAPHRVTDLIRPEPKPLYALRLLDASGEAETFHATDDHPWRVYGKGWVETADLEPGNRIITGSGTDMVVTSLTLTGRIEKTYNLTVANWHTFMVGEDQAVVHNACRHSPERQALEAMAKDAKRRGFLSRDDFKVYLELNGELPDPIPPEMIRIDEGHARGNATSRAPHAHIGSVNHIPIVDSW